MAIPILQKAVTPQMAQAYVKQGLDRVAGYVVRASEVASITSTEELFELHGLGFDGSPFAPDQPLHVLHLPQPPTATLLRALGGTTPEAVAQAGGGFLERPPFRGDGTTGVGDLETELMWLEHTRLTPGTRLWRFEPGADQPVLVGTYHGVVFGWQDHEEGDVFRPLATRGLVGVVATTSEGVFPADVKTKEDGTPNLVTVVSYNQSAGEQGFTRTKAGTYARQLSFREVDALLENHVTARWHSLPVRVIDEGKGEDGNNYVRVFSLGRDSAAAERLGMDKMDVGCYETVAPAEALTDIVRSQRVPKAWAREEQLANAEAAAAQVQAQAQRAAEQRANAPQPLLNEVNAPMVGMPIPTGEDGKPVDPSDPRAAFGPVLQRIAQGVINTAPAGWTRIRVLGRMLGNGGDIMIAATMPDGKDVGMQRVPQDVPRALAQLRHLNAKQGEGTWYTALLTIEPAGKISMNLDNTGEPKLTKGIDEKRLREEAQYFPRDEEHTPEWLAAKFAEHGIDPAAEAEAGREQRERAVAARDVDVAGGGAAGGARHGSADGAGGSGASYAQSATTPADAEPVAPEGDEGSGEPPVGPERPEETVGRA